MAKIIDGKAYAEGLRGRIAKAVTGLKAEHGLTPGLAVVLVGEDPASKVYVANKAKQTVEVGMNSWEHKLPAETPEADVLALVEKLNNDPAVHGILVQLPLPKHIDFDQGAHRHLARQGRRRLPCGERRQAVDRPGLARALHAGRLRDAGEGRAGLARRAGSRGDRPLQHRRQAGGAAAAGRELHRHHRAFARPRTCPASSAAPISSSPPWAGPRWSRATG